MDLRAWGSKRLFMVMICLPPMFQIGGAEGGLHGHDQSLSWMGPVVAGTDRDSRRSEFLLAEMKETKDSVIYSTDPKDGEYERRQWEEREKERKSWDMLKNMIIDGRQPPRRFSEPPRNVDPR